METPSAGLDRFVPPDWNRPLDVEEEIAQIPPNATISGMFMGPLAAEALRAGRPLPSARDRYLPFQFYPLAEHARLLVETCAWRYPGTPIRRALGRLGKGAPGALLESTLGKVMLGSAEGVFAAVRAMAAAYPINVKPCSVTVADEAADSVVVHIEELHYFVDSHHVGAFQGVLRYAKVSGEVLVHATSRTSADFLLRWRI